MRTTRQRAQSRDRERKKRATQRQERKRTGERKIHMPDGVWTYAVSKSKLVLRDSKGEKIVVRLEAVPGVSFTGEETCCVVPSMVRAFIEGARRAPLAPGFCIHHGTYRCRSCGVEAMATQLGGET